MKTLNPDQQQQVNRLIADLEGQQPNSMPTIRFVARGIPTGGEFGGAPS